MLAKQQWKSRTPKSRRAFLSCSPETDSDSLAVCQLCVRVLTGS